MKKRKFKLFASLTSLVLVVAVMAVGVWAATAATVTITGTVSYATQGNVYATIDVAEKGTNDADYVALNTQQKFLGGETGTTTQPYAGKEYTLTVSKFAAKTDDSLAAHTYSYTVTIVNTAIAGIVNPAIQVTPEKVPATLSANGTTASCTYVLAGGESTALTTSGVKVGVGQTLVITYSISHDPAYTLNSTDIGLGTITLTATA